MQFPTGSPIYLYHNNFHEPLPQASSHKSTTSNLAEYTPNKLHAPPFDSSGHSKTESEKIFSKLSPVQIQALALSNIKITVNITQTTNISPEPDPQAAKAAESLQKAAESLSKAAESMELKHSKPNKQKTSHKTQFYKTEMCRQYLNGFCKLESRCLFAHGEEELNSRQRPRKYKTIPCNKPPGQCPYGSRCLYIHSEEIDKKKMESQSRMGAQSLRT